MVVLISRVIVVFFLLLLKVFSAQSQGARITEIDKAINEKKFEQADVILKSVVENFYAAGKPDSLVNYIFYVGKLARARADADQAVKTVLLFIEKIKRLAPTPATLRQTYIEIGEFYGSIGLNSEAYKSNLEAQRYTLAMPAKKPRDLGLIENNLSTYAQRMGDLNLSQGHGRNALKFFLADPSPNYEGLYIACNGMGSALWYASKIDSAMYFFNMALGYLAKAPATPVNKYYRPAVVQNNLSALYSAQGKTTEAIQALKSTIANLKNFLSTPEPNIKKVTAKTFQFEATDNLAGIYKELGDLRKARDLLEYSYQQKMANLGPGDPAIFISQILLGQLYFAMRDFDKSFQYLNNGLAKIAASDGDYLFWQADACNTLALLYDERHNAQQATYYYERADSLYEVSLQGAYDNIYLEFLTNAALYYAESGQSGKAIAKANKGYKYIVKTQGEETLLAFNQLLNLSEVYYLSGQYAQALSYSRKGLDVVNKRMLNSENLLDSIKTELKKPKAILLKVKAEYELLKAKNVTTLTALLGQLTEALALLERRKSIINDPGDISLLMADHADLLQFIKKLTLDLYLVSRRPEFLDRLIGLHESGNYNRIRARLDMNDSLKFADIPANMQATERQLKLAIPTALQGEEPHVEKMQRYFTAVDNWNKYQETIRLNHPRYYKMRYASIFKSTGEIQKGIPPNTTVVRYFYIGKDLFALVADSKQKEIFPLDNNGIDKKIALLSAYSMDAVKTGEVLLSLHQQLWLPFSKNIYHKKIVIIPDGILYNLNFEILTPVKISSFKELATGSLLTDLTISYHYSLFLLGKAKKNSEQVNNFVGFAPGFSDKIKRDYQAISKDSMEMDKGYLSLLPQPFTIDLATKTRRLLGGSVFINDQSTESTFKSNAGKHKIIHIGTHAESNNDHPEFSRLIFAKNTSAKEEDNSLFVGEIYNCDLTSDLAVLTACESGMPGYQDGEGMISLAHAFNYAGSESILTGLWKIDEQASALILNYFYKNLLDGLPKDEALRKAKLSYLEEAEGRMLSPRYWAGLVIMGDTAPVVLEKRKPVWLWWLVAGGLLIILLTGILIYKRQHRK